VSIRHSGSNRRSYWAVYSDLNQDEWEALDDASQSQRREGPTDGLAVITSYVLSVGYGYSAHVFILLEVSAESQGAAESKHFRNS
jgi:hypothetical protein